MHATIKLCVSMFTFKAVSGTMTLVLEDEPSSNADNGWSFDKQLFVDAGL